MKILVFGASGATGHELVKQALLQGHIVTAFARTAAKLTITHHNLSVIPGDVVNYKIVADTVKEQDAVISALGAASPFRYDQSVTDGVSNIIKAMERHSVERFIYMSFAGVKDARNKAGFLIRHILSKILATEIRGHETRENIIRRSSLQWTIVRPTTLTNGKHSSQFRSGEEISTNRFTSTISRADVADFMLRQVGDNRFVKKEPLVMY